MARKTLVDLLIARDQTEWYWRVLGTLAPVLILLGFLVFPTSFPITKETSSSQSTLSIISVILLALGYSLSVALWFICRSWIFQLDVLFVPCLLSCFLGAINTGISLGVHPSKKIQWGPAPISALALALVSSSIYGLLSIYTFHKIRSVRLSDARSRQHDHPSSENATLISEEDLQRKQFGRLLSQSERSSPFASSGTYRIDIPDNARLGRNAAPVQLRDTGRSVSPYSEHEYNTYDTSSASAVQPQTSFEYVPPAAPRVEGKAAALQAARDRTVHNARSRERMAHKTYLPPVPPQPPVVGGARGADLGDIPLSERHPLEREGGFVRGGNKDGKQDLYGGRTYRPQSEESGDVQQQPRFEIVESGEDVHFDLGATRRTTGGLDGTGGLGSLGVRNELEARMPRERESVVTDDTGVGSWRSQGRR